MAREGETRVAELTEVYSSIGKMVSFETQNLNVQHQLTLHHVQGTMRVLHRKSNRSG